AIYLKAGNQFLETFFLTQNLERFATTLLGHGGGPIFYIVVLALGLFPLSVVVPRGLGQGFGYLKSCYQGKELGLGERLTLFAFVSFLWIFLLLTVAATKQINYIVPAIPFLAIIIAEGLKEGQELVGWSRFLLFVVAAAVGAAALVLIFGLDILWANLDRLIRFDSTEYAFPQSPPHHVKPWGIALLMVDCIALWLFVGGRGLLRQFLSGLLFSTFLVILFLPFLARTFQGPAKEMAQDVRTVIHGEESQGGHKVRIVSFGLWKPSMIFYLGHPIKRIKVKHPERLNKALSDSDICIVFTRQRLLERLHKVAPGFYVIKTNNGYLLGGNLRAKGLFQGKEPLKKHI
ncbi:MAG: hypothetical protein GXO58_09580, partial [Thermodesulfobacteria bacterium]|nr:hypothetical protein [Thermodesulfobacteriota bacterium]